MPKVKKEGKNPKDSKKVSVLDEGYNYAGPALPGKMKAPATLKTAEKKHVRRKG